MTYRLSPAIISEARDEIADGGDIDEICDQIANSIEDVIYYAKAWDLVYSADGTQIDTADERCREHAAREDLDIHARIQMLASWIVWDEAYRALSADD